ncbi:hypothetical protein NA57DRAFT_48024, partial [Rhizodiscina lignyota]
CNMLELYVQRDCQGTAGLKGCTRSSIEKIESDKLPSRTNSEDESYQEAGTARHFPEVACSLQNLCQPFLISKFTDASITDPSLLRKHSTYESYSITSPVTGRSITYPSIRTFYHPHPQAAKLPTSPTPLPLIVFIHGLGGSVAQFHPLLTSLVNVAPCLAIDLPGCGCSAFEPADWEAYKLENLAALVATAIDRYREDSLGQEVVLIGHSMGCSLSVLLASPNNPLSTVQNLSKHVLGLVAICPRADAPSPREVKAFKKLLSIPGPIFNLWRQWDRRGGTESASVKRFVGPNAEEGVKRLQVRFNEQSRTPVWRRMARGMLPQYSKSGQANGGLPGRETWSALQVPILLMAGESDHITPALEVEKIAGFLGKASRTDPSERMEHGEPIVDAAAPIDSSIIDSKLRPKSNVTKRADSGASVTTTGQDQLFEERPTLKRRKTHAAALKTTILPSPASHALLYAPSTARIIAGLIQTFLSSHIDPRLSLGWQLQYLTTEGKWDVKNLVKWQSETGRTRNQPPVFRAMKTLREVDDVHSPAIFVEHWRGKIQAVVDISHESPVYDPQGLEKGGIQYHKFPTVSKLPPTVDEVKAFIDLIDRLRVQLGTESNDHNAAEDPEDAPVIGVHCHYGFNRTGFFLVCYLVERLGFKLEDAIHEFERQRPPGIRHGHFIDQLFVRYCAGLQRRPTL